MSIEEKANAYDNALNKAKQLLFKCKRVSDKASMIYRAEDIESMFPELKESEDEKIRKELIKWCEEFPDLIWRGHDKNKVLAWLEKQGKQNSTDKVEPKFKAGDWLVFNGLTLYINEVVKGYYRTISKGGIPNSYNWDIDNAARLWTIQDAKDGDVLAVDWHQGDDYWEKIIIFKKYHNKGIEGLIHAPCVEGYGNTFKNGKMAFVGEVPDYSKTWTDNLHPATKEQRDQLEKAMANAGYKWNKEERKPEKI